MLDTVADLYRKFGRRGMLGLWRVGSEWASHNLEGGAC